MRIKEILKEKGLDQNALAQKMGISQPSISVAINGNPTLEMLERIAAALEVSMTELFEKKTDSSTQNCPHCGKAITIHLQ